MASPPARPQHRSWLAVIGGIAWTGLLIGAGIWATGQGLPILWIFIGPWLIPGVLLAIWGFQAPPEEPPRP